jgi:hypothetical protein
VVDHHKEFPLPRCARSDGLAPGIGDKFVNPYFYYCSRPELARVGGFVVVVVDLCALMPYKDGMVDPISRLFVNYTSIVSTTLTYKIWQGILTRNVIDLLKTFPCLYRRNSIMLIKFFSERVTCRTLHHRLRRAGLDAGL